MNKLGGDGDVRIISVPVNMTMSMRTAFIKAHKEAIERGNGDHVSADYAWRAAINNSTVESESLDRAITDLIKSLPPTWDEVRFYVKAFAEDYKRNHD